MTRLARHSPKDGPMATNEPTGGADDQIESNGLSSAASTSDDPARETSQQRIDANRRNAQRSTGPRTEDGKAASSRNAVRHGVYGSPVPVPRGLFREEPEDVAAVIEETVATLKPNNAMALTAAHQFAAVNVRLDRLERLEAERMAGASHGEEHGLEEQYSSCLERMAARIDSDLDALSSEEWREVACLIAIDNDVEEIIIAADPNADGETLAVDDPSWEYVGRDLLDEYYDAPGDFAAELRARVATVREARGEADDKALERAAKLLIDEGPLEKCSLIRARLSREADRAFARFQLMQALPS